jgi:hypothetical protein
MSLELPERFTSLSSHSSIRSRSRSPVDNPAGMRGRQTQNLTEATLQSK